MPCHVHSPIKHTNSSYLQSLSKHIPRTLRLQQSMLQKLGAHVGLSSLTFLSQAAIADMLLMRRCVCKAAQSCTACLVQRASTGPNRRLKNVLQSLAEECNGPAEEMHAIVVFSMEVQWLLHLLLFSQLQSFHSFCGHKADIASAFVGI